MMPMLTKVFTAKILKPMWNSLNEEEKNVWRHRAAEAKIDHGIKYPHYKYNPRPSASIPRRKQNRPKKTAQAGSMNAQPAIAFDQPVAGPASAPAMVQPPMPFAPQPALPEIPNEPTAQEQRQSTDEYMSRLFDFEGYDSGQSFQQQDQQQVQESQDSSMGFLENKIDNDDSDWEQISEGDNVDSDYPLGPLV